MNDFRTDKNVEIHHQEANDHPGFGFARGIQQKAGEALVPPGFVYEGTAAVHIYSKKNEILVDRTDNAFICVINGFQEVVENQADAAMKSLQADLMKKYGRKVPEWRKS